MYGTPFFDFDFLTETAAALRFTPLWYTVPINGFGVAFDLLTGITPFLMRGGNKTPSGRIRAYALTRSALRTRNALKEGMRVSPSQTLPLPHTFHILTDTKCIS